MYNLTRKGFFMKNILFGSLLVMSFIALTGCTGADASSTEGTKSAKCGEGKCGGDKKAEKCGEGKCGGDKKEATEKKCGEGKCGGDKK